MSKAIALLSGGLDSCVANSKYRFEHLGDEMYGLSFNYGQKHSIELKYAKIIGEKLEVKEHKIVNINLSVLESSALTGTGKIPEFFEGEGLPPTFVPGRNAIMLSVAFGYAYSVGAETIIGGWNVQDYSGYPDCREEFLMAMQMAGSLAVDKQIQIYYPLIELNKKEIILEGMRVGAPLAYTWSCYRGHDKPCGQCDSCYYRAKGFEEAGVKDPFVVRIG